MAFVATSSPSSGAASGAATSAKQMPFTGTDGSGTITTGATAQNIFGGSVPTNGFGIYNPDAFEELWVSDSATAAPNAVGSIYVPAGGGYETPPGYKPIQAVSLYGATTGHKFTARRW